MEILTGSIRFIIYLILIYFFLTIYFYLVSDHYIFVPPKTTYVDTDDIIKLKTKYGDLISALFLPNQNATYTVLISHGNAEDLGRMRPFLNQFRDHGFSIFAYDYHGYGTSMGKPTESNTYSDIEAAYQYLTSTLHISPDRIILYGRSLGAALAIDLASKNKVAGLIIECPFLSIYRIYTQIPLFLLDKFDNLSKIKKVKCPVLVMHGKLDKDIPFSHGLKLYNAVPTQKYSLWLETAQHGDISIVGGERYWQTIENFSQKLGSPGTVNIHP